MICNTCIDTLKFVSGCTDVILYLRSVALSSCMHFFQFIRYSLFTICFSLLLLNPASAQRHVMNMAEHDQKAYYFGLSFGLNFSQYRIQYTQSFADNDTFKRIQTGWAPGFNLGLMGNLRLNKYVDLRLIPTLSFAEKKLSFNTPAKDSIENRAIESIYLHLPLQLKFKSDRLRNFRFYGLLGGKFDYDLAANARSRKTDEYLKVKPIDVGAEIGVGFEFYYPNFIFSPEIKLSQGFMNQIYRDRNLPLTNAIDQINTRTIVISIHIEG